MYYLCEKYYKSITVQYYIANCVSCVPRLILLDLWIHSWNRTHSYVGDLLYLFFISTSLIYGKNWQVMERTDKLGKALCD